MESLWAITCYFNPCSYQRRLLNYKIFRKFLNVSLVTVELSFNGKFDLAEDDADILLQIKGNENNIMWQKERLLNIALQHLPAQCDKFVWLDCDIVFDDQNWAKKTELLLDQVELVQPFAQIHHLGKKTPLENLNIEILKQEPTIVLEPSFIKQYTSLNPLIFFNRLNSRTTDGAPGHCMAMRKDIFTNNKLYDSCIIGGGDTALIAASLSDFERLVKRIIMNEHQIQHYLEWAQPFSKVINKKIAYLDSIIYHLWHGDFINRQYLERHKKLAQFDFNPYTDITLDDNSCWRWNSNKPELHQQVKDYFYLRKEDD